MSVESQELIREAQSLKRAIPAWGLAQVLAFAVLCATLAYFC